MVLCYTLPFLPQTPALLRWNWHIIFILPLTTITLSYSLYWNDILKGQIDILLAKACFKCPPHTTHFPKPSSIYPFSPQSHLPSLLKKHPLCLWSGPISGSASSELTLLFQIRTSSLHLGACSLVVIDKHRANSLWWRAVTDVELWQTRHQDPRGKPVCEVSEVHYQI